MEHKEGFSFTYSAEQQKEVEAIPDLRLYSAAHQSQLERCCADDPLPAPGLRLSRHHDLCDGALCILCPFHVHCGYCEIPKTGQSRDDHGEDRQPVGSAGFPAEPGNGHVCPIRCRHDTGKPAHFYHPHRRRRQYHSRDPFGDPYSKRK